MTQQVHVNLSFTADVAQAKQQLASLQSTLTDISTKSLSGIGTEWTQEISKATQAALQLKTHLQNATNVTTGTLDFTKLNTSIKKSGMTLSEYASQLQALGPTGQQAFMQLAGAISQSEVPIRRANTALKEMAVTMKNTAKWQLSSSVLHGFMGAIQSAYGYAQDLNESLNNIRIVTGQNIDQMSRFAEQANKAAKALSATTTEYTDASLIYFQQGDSSAEVAEKAAITVKMANTTGESAQKVSDQLTAVWNNFDNGTKSLEYYVDVMAKLGAETASSTDEIAQGLEKFAAIAETVGLSYEYATSALATVTAETRQSADVVGTAFKTIFARIEGLELGETLEDGTDLNQYSEALLAVGVNIKNANGELKDMDTILKEMSGVWETLNRDEKVALAQKVAGVRQYNQLMSLMENWDVMEANLSTAYNASGTLDEQAEIYAESWDAASKRVQAAAESIYTSLINDEFFIDMLNSIEDILGYVDTLIDSFGGLKGIILTVGTVMTQVFSKQMSQGIKNMSHNIMVSSSWGRDQIEKEREVELSKMGEMMASGYDKIGDPVGKATAKQFTDQLKLQEKFLANQKNMSETEIQAAKQVLDIRKQITEQVIEATQKVQNQKNKVSDSYLQGYGEALSSDKENAKGSFTKGISDLKNNEEAFIKITKVIKDYYFTLSDSQNSSSDQFIKAQKKIKESLGLVIKDVDEQDKILKGLFNAIKSGESTEEGFNQILAENTEFLQKNISAAKEKLKEAGLTEETIERLVQDYRLLAEAVDEQTEAENRAAEAQKRAEEQMEKSKKQIKDWADGIVAGAQVLTSFGSIISSIQGAIETIKDPDLSGWEKFVALLSSFGNVASMTIFMLNSMSTAITNLKDSQIKETAAKIINSVAEGIKTKAREKSNEATKKGIILNKEYAKSEDGVQKENLETAASEGLKNKSKDQPIKLKDSFKELGKASKQWISANKSLIKSFGLAAAAIALVAGAVAGVKYHLEKADIEAENAARQAELLSESYGKVKESYDSFVNSITSYKDITSSMSELTEGTVEYNEALIKANDEAAALMKTHKDLANSYTIEDGLITFDEETLEKAQQAELDKLKQAQLVSLSSQSYANEKKLEAEKTDVKRDLKSTHDANYTIGNASGAGLVGMAAGTLTSATIAVKMGAAIGTALSPGIGTAIGGAIGLLAGGITTAIAGAQTNKEDETLDQILELYQTEEGKSMFASEEVFEDVLRNKLKIDDEKLIDSLVNDMEAIQQLTKSVDENTKAQLLQLKNSIVQQYGEDIANTGLSQEQQDFLAEILTNDAKESSEALYTSKYQDEGWLDVNKEYSDKEIQAMFAEEMGYDVSKTENKSGNKAIYYDTEGNEVGEISDEFARKYLAEKEARDSLGETISGQAGKIRELNAAEKELVKTHGDSVQNYESYKTQLIEQGKALGFSQKEVEEYISEYGTNKRANKKMAIASNLQNLNVNKESSMAFVDAFGKNLSDESLQLAVDASKSAISIDDFERQFETAVQESFANGLNTSISNVETLLEDSEITADEILNLESDENFVQFLEDSGKTMVDITNATYTERAAIVSEYYNNLREMQRQVTEDQIANYEEDLGEYQAIIDYKRAIERGDTESSQGIAEAYAGIDFTAYADMDISEIESKIDQIEEAMDSVRDQKIQVALEWDGIEEIEHSFESLGDFASLMQNDAKKVGNSYQLTAAQAKEWMQVYPDLFNQATLAEGGIMELNQETVDAYIKGQEDMIDASIDKKIESLKLEKEEMLATKAKLQADLEMTKTTNQGIENLEGASAEYLRDLRKNLTQYYIDLHGDEVKANEQALKDMGLTQEEYSRLVAQASYDTSITMQKSATEGAATWRDRFQNLWDNLKQFFTQVKNIIKNIVTLNWDEVSFDFTWTGPEDQTQVSSEITLDSGVKVDDYDFSASSDPYVSQAAMQTAVSKIEEEYNKSIDNINKSVNSIDNQILYLEALKAQDAEDYGSTSVDDVTEKEKEKEKEDKKKKLDEEAERYHEINEELDDLNRNLDKISKATDKAFGKSKLALIDKEIAATKDLISTTEDYVRAAEANRQKDAAKLNAFGAQYDSAGRVTNYEEMYTREIQLYNAAVETGDEAAIEAAEKRYEDFQKILNNYEDSLNTVEEKQEQLENYLDSIDELELSKIEYTIELNVQLNQDDLDYIDYQLKMLGNDAYDDAESLALLEQKAASLQAQGKAYADGIAMLLSQKGLNDAQIAAVQKGNLSAIEGIEFTAEEIQLIQSSIKGMQDSNIGLMELNGQIENVLPASFEKWNEKIDENLEKFDYYDSVANHFKNIIDIVGKKPLGITSDYLKEMGLVQVANNKNEIQALTSTMEELEKQRAEAQEKLANAKTDKQKEYWQNMLDDIEDREADIQGRILTSTEETLQKIAEIYTQEIQNSLDEFEKKVAGSFETLEKLQEHYNRQKTLSEQYLADYKKLYELNKLNRQLDAAIDDTASVKNKKILQELQEEINEAMKSGTKLSEYDLEVLKKKYDLKLAEAALDEAKNAKSQVRLVRNQEGAYNYMYTADEEEVDNAIQNYEDKLFELQDLNETYIEEMGAAFIQVQQEMVDALSKIQLQDFESYADYKKAVDETIAYYQARMNFYSSELQKGLDNNVSLYENEYQKCAEFNDLKIGSYETFTTEFSGTILGQLQDSYKTIEEYQKAVNIAIAGEDGKSGLLGDLLTGYEEWRTLTDGVLNDAGTDMSTFAGDVATALVGDDPGSVAETLGLSSENFDTFRKTLNEHVTRPGDGLNASMESWRDKVWGSAYGDKGIIKSSDDTKEKIDTLATDASTDFSNLAGAVEDWQTRWENSIKPAIETTDGLLGSYNNLVERLAEDISLPDLEKTVVITTKHVDETNYNPNPPPAPDDTNDDNQEQQQQNDSSGTPGTNPADIIKYAAGFTKKAAQQADLTPATTAHADETVKFDSVYDFLGKKYYVFEEPHTGLRMMFKPSDVTVSNGYITVKKGTPVYIHPEDEELYKQIQAGSTTTSSTTTTTSTTTTSPYYGHSINGGTGAAGQWIANWWSSKFDTGGYTGEWGPEGKMAMLHEKEIVLNKEDTSNLLTAVGMIREMSNILEVKASQQQALGVQEFLHSQLLSGLQQEARESIIEQQITIQAEFPDASDHLQIKEAFSNLINTASQYANRKEIKKT